METQNKEVLRYLRKNKSITAFQAMSLPGIVMRLSARIYDLKYKGFLKSNEVIETIIMTSSTGKRYAKYVLKSMK